ncbi:hypothetical protein HDU76_008357 [Blyttiomyces sp. JEL0837]|nr:hypothetical protein HDU76_008357 [Blyttiomyces sp. JEL0837]
MEKGDEKQQQQQQLQTGSGTPSILSRHDSLRTHKVPVIEVDPHPSSPHLLRRQTLPQQSTSSTSTNHQTESMTNVGPDIPFASHLSMASLKPSSPPPITFNTNMNPTPCHLSLRRPHQHHSHFPLLGYTLPRSHRDSATTITTTTSTSSSSYIPNEPTTAQSTNAKQLAAQDTSCSLSTRSLRLRTGSVSGSIASLQQLHLPCSPHTNARLSASSTPRGGSIHSNNSIRGTPLGTPPLLSSRPPSPSESLSKPSPSPSPSPLPLPHSASCYQQPNLNSGHSSISNLLNNSSPSPYSSRPRRLSNMFMEEFTASLATGMGGQVQPQVELVPGHMNDRNSIGLSSFVINVEHHDGHGDHGDENVIGGWRFNKDGSNASGNDVSDGGGSSEGGGWFVGFKNRMTSRIDDHGSVGGGGSSSRDGSRDGEAGGGGGGGKNKSSMTLLAWSQTLFKSRHDLNNTHSTGSSSSGLNVAVNVKSQSKKPSGGGNSAHAIGISSSAFNVAKHENVNDDFKDLDDDGDDDDYDIETDVQHVDSGGDTVVSRRGSAASVMNQQVKKWWKKVRGRLMGEKAGNGGGGEPGGSGVKKRSGRVGEASTRSVVRASFSSAT